MRSRRVDADFLGDDVARPRHGVGRCIHPRARCAPEQNLPPLHHRSFETNARLAIPAGATHPSIRPSPAPIVSVRLTVRRPSFRPAPSCISPGAGVDAAPGDVTATDANTTVTRPNFSVVGRLFVHGPSGNVAVGDISTYNDTSGSPAQKLEVDGSAMIRGDVVFHNSNGESSIVVLDSNANALTVKDAGASPITYWKINSDSQRLETHAPIHILDTRIEAKDNDANGLQFTAEAGNPIVTLDTTDSAENVKVAYPINARDATDSCATSVDGTCSALASVVTTGGLTVGKKTFMTGAWDLPRRIPPRKRLVFPPDSRVCFPLLATRRRSRGGADEGP